MRRNLAILAAMVALLLVGGIAYAAIPDSNGVIHACRKTSAPDKGLLRVLDSEAGRPVRTAGRPWIGIKLVLKDQRVHPAHQGGKSCGQPRP
jgi:hypothetical protein